MTTQKPDSRVPAPKTRRDFFKMLAGSPLLALMYPTLSTDWQRSVRKEILAQAPQGTNPNVYLERQLEGQLIDTVDEAVNVWDFEQVAHANNLPQHWAYLHMGVDDFETRRANREGFLRLQLRPKRLG